MTTARCAGNLHFRFIRGVHANVAVLALVATALCQPQSEAADASDQLSNLSLEQLSNLEVTSVSKASEPLSQAASAIYVITHDDIVRSGATSIPEVLRLAPNLTVTQMSSSDYVITARGLGGNQPAQNFSNKLLVLIDGRSVYSPLYSGVYFDVQDVVLQDIDRIEVISGPGATLWGANAMNGVINIITRASYLTRGALVDVEGGNLEQNVSARYGESLNDQTALRVYGKSFRRGEESQPDGAPDPHDSWDKTQGGFRLDWSGALDTLTLQGDAYRGSEHELDTAAQGLVGADALARWQRTTPDSQWQLQTYVDETERVAPGGAPAFVLHTYDAELQQALLLGSTNRLVWGAGERVNDYVIAGTPSFQFVPSDRTLTLGDVFAQDTYSVTSTVKLTAGLKLEDDPYSGWSVLPDVRAAWEPTAHSLLWAAASRAVRSPTPFDEDVLERQLPIAQIVGDRDFSPENVRTYEVGFRGQADAVLSLSASLFYNQYTDLRTIEFGPSAPVDLSLTWGNLMRGDTAGIELWADWQVTPWWRLSPGVRTLHENFSFEPGASRILGAAQAGDDPSGQATVTSSMELGRGLTLDATWRYVGALPNPALPSYNELNVRLGWHLSRSVEVALAGSNLLQAYHLEAPLPYAEYIDREVLAEVTYRPGL